MQVLIKFDQFVHKILSGNKILTIIKGHNASANLRKLTRNIPKQDLVKINDYAKFDPTPSIRSQNIKRKRNFDNTKDHNSFVKLKLTRNNSKIDLVNFNAYSKFVQIPSIRSKDIERKRNFDNKEGPCLCCKAKIEA